MRRTSPERSPICDRVPHLEGALDEEDEPGDEVVHHRLEAEADADAERAHQDGDAVEIHPHGRHREDEAQQQDGVVEQGGHRVREPARQADARVDVLFEDEADQARDEEGQPHRHPEGHHVADREAQVAAGDAGGEHAAQRGPRLVLQAERSEHGQRPAAEGEPAEHPARARLDQRAVSRDEAQVDERPGAEGVGDQSQRHAKAGVEHHGEVAEGQRAGAQEPPQPHVADGAQHGGHRHRAEHAEPERPEQRGAARGGQRPPPPGQHPGEIADAHEHLADEDQLVEERHHLRDVVEPLESVEERRARRSSPAAAAPRAT